MKKRWTKLKVKPLKSIILVFFLLFLIFVLILFLQLIISAWIDYICPTVLLTYFVRQWTHSIKNFEGSHYFYMFILDLMETFIKHCLLSWYINMTWPIKKEKKCLDHAVCITVSVLTALQNTSSNQRQYIFPHTAYIFHFLPRICRKFKTNIR